VASPSATRRQDFGHGTRSIEPAEAIHGRPNLISDQEDSSMKHQILSSFVLVALLCALTFPAAAPAAPPAGSSHAATSAAPTPAAEPHPEIREAIAALRRAKEHMEHAAHDFGGHRVEALKATDEAIHQLEICLKFDK
jgi:hypothetical protein